MKTRTTLACLIALTGANLYAAERVASLDDLPLDADSYNNGADLAGGFVSEGVTFHNSYNADWFSWSGFAYSNVNAPDTPGWANQYAAASATDVSGDGIYGVGYDDSFDPEADTIELPEPSQVRGLYLNNTAFAALSMRDGDAFTKKFGGETGDDSDFFMVRITGKDPDGLELGSVDFYLADYRFEDNSLDYVVTDWTWVELTSLGPDVATLHFALSSSDNGDWGMNTPAYFAVDDVTFVPGSVWETHHDLALDALELDGTRRWLKATAQVSNLGGLSTPGWVIVVVTHPDLRRPIFRWRRMRALEPGETTSVRVRCLPRLRWLPSEGYTVHALVLPRRLRDDITLENNHDQMSFDW